MHFVADVHLIAIAGAGVVALALQILNLWRSLANGRRIATTARQLDGVADVARDLQTQMHVARQALNRMQQLLQPPPATYGRRATDPPGSPMPPRKTFAAGSAPATDPRPGT